MYNYFFFSLKDNKNYAVVARMCFTSTFFFFFFLSPKHRDMERKEKNGKVVVYYDIF